MAEVIIMPKLGFNMSEGKLVKWYKQEGDAVAKGENLFSIETDKTNMDIEATNDGTVRKLLIDEGDKIPVTLPIAIVGTPDENIDALVADAVKQLSGSGAEVAAFGATPTAAQSGEVSKHTTNAIPMGNGELKITPRARRVAKELGIPLEAINIQGTGFQGGICEKDVRKFAETYSAGAATGKASPLAKKIAGQEGVALSEISGSGVNGKVMSKDVLGYVAAGTVEDVASAFEKAQDGKEILEKTPYAGVRKIIGDRLSQSMQEAPHIFFTQSVNIEKLLEMRASVNSAQEKKTSVTDFIAKAAVIALQKYPNVNASLQGDTIIKYKTVNLGIAVAAPRGLIVPVVKFAEKKNVVEISKESSVLIEKARNGKLTPDEYTGGTFTISNLGMFGIENFTAIINPPESGILAISATKDTPVVVVKEDGSKQIEIKPVMNIQFSGDHRVIDGLLAAQFVTEIKTLLENPISLFI